MYYKYNIYSKTYFVIYLFNLSNTGRYSSEFQIFSIIKISPCIILHKWKSSHITSHKYKCISEISSGNGVAGLKVFKILTNIAKLPLETILVWVNIHSCHTQSFHITKEMYFQTFECLSI